MCILYREPEAQKVNTKEQSRNDRSTLRQRKGGAPLRSRSLARHWCAGATRPGYLTDVERVRASYLAKSFTRGKTRTPRSASITGTGEDRSHSVTLGRQHTNEHSKFNQDSQSTQNIHQTSQPTAARLPQAQTQHRQDPGTRVHCTPLQHAPATHKPPNAHIRNTLSSSGVMRCWNSEVPHAGADSHCPGEWPQLRASTMCVWLPTTASH